MLALALKKDRQESEYRRGIKATLKCLKLLNIKERNDSNNLPSKNIQLHQFNAVKLSNKMQNDLIFYSFLMYKKAQAGD